MYPYLLIDAFFPLYKCIFISLPDNPLHIVPQSLIFSLSYYSSLVLTPLTLIYPYLLLNIFFPLYKCFFISLNLSLIILFIKFPNPSYFHGLTIMILPWYLPPWPWYTLPFAWCILSTVQVLLYISQSLPDNPLHIPPSCQILHHQCQLAIQPHPPAYYFLPCCKEKILLRLFTVLWRKFGGKRLRAFCVT